jgi:hypothetical protein
MVSTDVAVAPAAARSQLRGLLEREGLVVGVVAAFAVSVAYRLPLRVAQDAWLALVAGRQVVHYGIPASDALTYWTAGRHWIDEQWLAQAISYAVYSVGGLKLFALSHVALVVFAISVAGVTARRRGASPRATAWTTLVSAYLLGLTAGHVRTQSFAYPLFALVLAVVLDDDRRPSRRVLLAIPVLALWANLHGSVVLGAVLVGLYGALVLLHRAEAGARRTVGAMLLAGSLLALIATPWFVGTVAYYRSTLFNSAFKDVVAEWRAPTLSVELLPFYLLAGGGLWLLGRCSRRFTAFDRLALLVLIVLSFAAQRNIAWLALGAVPLLAPALDDVLPRRSAPIRGRANVLVAAVGCVFACLVVAGSALRSESSYLSSWPSAAAAAVAGAAQADPAARIYANEQYADWLLMTEPQLRGRLAYDARFELLSRSQLTAVFDWRNRLGPDWERAAEGARVVVLSLPSELGQERALLAHSGTRALYRDRTVSVLLRPRKSSPASAMRMSNDPKR